MSHEIRENDNMFSVREKPWHGLGNVIPEAPSIDEAIIASGLDWTASLKSMKVPMQDDQGFTYDLDVPDNFAIVRNDTQKVLGIVGNRYQVYQNSEMWAFIDEFQKQSGIKLETAGSLRNGRTTWVLAKNGTMEAISGDPIEEYFLFRNSFDGSSPISCMFTNIRVVCNNTLSAALKGTKNIFNVRHTASADGQIKEVQRALGIRSKYQAEVAKSFDTLAKYQMGSTDINNFLNEKIFPVKTGTVQTVGFGENVQPLFEISQRGETARTNKIDKVLELVETGAGTEISGVKGNAYGLYNALTEYADHEKSVRVTEGRNKAEVKFENAFFGTGSRFKMECFNELMKLAA